MRTLEQLAKGPKVLVAQSEMLQENVADKNKFTDRTAK